MKAIIGVATTVLLVLPIVILYLLTVHDASGGVKIGVLVIFVAAFAVVLATLTKASRHEMFGASAAYVLCPGKDPTYTHTSRYCAVLVVFLGNVPQK